MNFVFLWKNATLNFQFFECMKIEKDRQECQKSPLA